MSQGLFLLIFLAVVLTLLLLDLGVFHKDDHVVTFKEAAGWTCLWVLLAVAFGVFILLTGELIHGVHTQEQLIAIDQLHGHELKFDWGQGLEYNIKLYRKAMAMEYFTGYLVEESLSIDNIFVMIMIFMSFGVEKKYYHRVLFYGILGAIVLRFTFIFAAGALIQRFHWILFVFGAVLIYTGIKMFVNRNKKETIDVAHHPVVKFLSKRNLSTSEFHGHDFFFKKDGRWLLTPLFVVLLIIEFSDIIFAFDSIPAIFSITQDQYIVFFSNIFAIMGLRSLFFMLESVMDKFAYLKIGLSVLLTFIGVKMLLPLVGIHVGTFASMMVIIGILVSSVVLSLLFPPKKSVEQNL